jgi:hypothetical protein
MHTAYKQRCCGESAVVFYSFSVSLYRWPQALVVRTALEQVRRKFTKTPVSLLVSKVPISVAPRLDS